MKTTNPVDRALADVSRKMETVQRQLHTIGHETNAPVSAPLEPARSFLKRMLTPPARRPAVRPRQEVFDLPVNPLQELIDAPLTLPVPGAQPELFTARNAVGKLGQYLASSSLRPPKPQLKRVLRENRNSFYFWLALSCVAIWLIIAVVR